MRLPAGAFAVASVVSVLGCSARIDSATCPPSSAEIDAGPSYVRAFAASYAGALGALNVACDGTDERLSGDCAANGGTVTESAAEGANGWHCAAAPDVPAKGEQIVGWVGCRAIGDRDAGP